MLGCVHDSSKYLASGIIESVLPESGRNNRVVMRPHRSKVIADRVIPLQSLLGLVPSAFENRLQVLRPVLPKFVQGLELRRLRVGKASVDLRFARDSDGNLATDVLKVRGNLNVEVSSASQNRAT